MGVADPARRTGRRSAAVVGTHHSLLSEPGSGRAAIGCARGAERPEELRPGYGRTRPTTRIEKPLPEGGAVGSAHHRHRPWNRATGRPGPRSGDISKRVRDRKYKW